MKQTMKLSIFATIMSLVSVNAFAHDFAVGGIYYKINENGTSVSVTFKGSSSTQYSNEYYEDIIIPEEVSNKGIKYAVTAIGSDAFYECNELTSVTIPNSVTEICATAFYKCVSLSSVTLGNSLIKIDTHAFHNCKKLVSLELPSTLTEIGSYAFSDCVRLTSIVIPSNINVINQGVFYNCEHLQSITIPNSIKVIGRNAFSGCSSITELTIPDSVEEIGAYAFSSCNSISMVVIGKNVSTIGSSAFDGCDNIETVYWNSNKYSTPTQSTSMPFYKNESIKTFIFSEGIEKIASHMCYGLSNLDFVSIPNSVKTIEWAAFSLCSSLRSVTIPNSVSTIGNNAFNVCGLTSIEIPNSVNSIGPAAFASCPMLQKVTIGANVKTIGVQAFSENKYLYEVTNYSAIPQQIEANVFAGVDISKCSLYVSEESYNLFIREPVWKDFIVKVAGVEEVEMDEATKEIEGYYDLKGVRLVEPVRGQVNIVRHTDGTSKKIIIE